MDPWKLYLLLFGAGMLTAWILTYIFSHYTLARRR